MKSERPKFNTRTIRLATIVQLDIALAMLQNAPLDADKPLELVLREQSKGRTPDQNSAMWAGPLRDIAEQAWVNTEQFVAEVWHEHFKELFLPDENDPELTPTDLAELVKQPETYRKWGFTPGGRRVLIGSTTQLTPKGFAQHMEQVHVFGASMGVQFHTVRQAA